MSFGLAQGIGPFQYSLRSFEGVPPLTSRARDSNGLTSQCSGSIPISLSFSFTRSAFTTGTGPYVNRCRIMLALSCRVAVMTFSVVSFARCTVRRTRAMVRCSFRSGNGTFSCSSCGLLMFGNVDPPPVAFSRISC